MFKPTYYMRQLVDPNGFLKSCKLSLLRKKWMYKDIRRHQELYKDQPYVANLKNYILIAETPIEIEYLSCWLYGRSW